MVDDVDIGHDPILSDDPIIATSEISGAWIIAIRDAQDMSPQETLDAGKRIAAARKAKKISQAELGQMMGVTQSVISDWERGGLVSWRAVEDQLCRVLGKPDGYFRDQVVESDQVRTVDRSDLPTLVEIPEYDVRLSAGPGMIPTSEEIRRSWPMPRFLIVDALGLNPANVAMQEVIGDSMAPTLQSGDYVLIDLADRRIGNPGIFAVWDGDALVCKRLERIPGEEPSKVRIKSDNPLHNEYTVLADVVNIVGRIRWFSRRA